MPHKKADQISPQSNQRGERKAPHLVTISLKKKVPPRKGHDIEESLQTLLDAFPSYVMLIDSEHYIVQANQAVHRDLRLNPEEIVGRYCPLAVHGLDHPFPGCPLEEAVSNGTPVEKELFDPDTGRWVSAAIYPTDYQTGEGHAVFLHIVYDITDKKQAEEKLRQAEEERQQFQRNLIQSERMATVGTVAAGIVHNLRGPLTSILGYGKLLQRKHPDSPDPEQIVSSAQQMSQMIEDILAKSQQKRNPEPTDLNTLLQGELDFLQANPVFKHEIEKDIRLTEDLPSIEGVYTDLSQAFGNLLRNAVDAMHQRDTKRLSVVTSFTEKHIIVEVTDIGCGIPEANIPRLFEPFFTTKPFEGEESEPKGTGLGLYMVQRLLEPYGADIEVESTVDVGTTFRVKIPL